MQYIGIILALALVFFFLERQYPNAPLPRVSTWYTRAFVFNLLQAFIAFVGTRLWDVWFAKVSVFALREWSMFGQIVAGYIILTFFYYWWHRVRHTSHVLWRFFHQFHHSPARIEIITSFYKSPIELVANSLISSTILYVFLGLSAQAVGLTVLLTALAELVYHVNLKTPRWMGYFFQRPEMHRVHHERGKHHNNYSDLPIWDMLFGTYLNPHEGFIETGFPDEGERRVWDLLTGKKLRI